MAARLGNVLYWFFTTVALLMAVSGFGDLQHFFGWLLGAACVFALGYAIRYILTGRKRVW